MRAGIAVLAGTLALSGCGTAAPQRPVGYTQQEFVVDRPARQLFSDLEDQMSKCHATNSLFARADLDSSFDPATGHGRLTIVRRGRTLWGAEVLAASTGKTRVLAFAARDVEADHYEWLIRQWAERLYKPGLYPDC